MRKPKKKVNLYDELIQNEYEKIKEYQKNEEDDTDYSAHINNIRILSETQENKKQKKGEKIARYVTVGSAIIIPIVAMTLYSKMFYDGILFDKENYITSATLKDTKRSFSDFLINFLKPKKF